MIKVIVLFLALTSFLYSQELNCKVIINNESLQSADRDRLEGFSLVVEDYLNKTSFTNNWEYDKIPCTMQLFFVSASNEMNYSAQVVISAQRPIYQSVKNTLLLSINDNSWSFTYERGQSLYQNSTTFDPLTGFLDYYAYIILGFYMESWEEFGGAPYFSKAFDVVNLGTNSRFSSGWERNSNSYSRRGLVDDLANDKYRPFRLAYYDYYYGIDIMAQKPEEGIQQIVGLVNTLDEMRKRVDVNSVLIKVFFDAKNGEIINYLKDYPDKEIFKKLKRIDPAHTSRYDALI
ncbi:MAG: DUF4835 family protein [Ignavibacteriaceae bacterium]